jgi:hypothetical protein
MRKIFAVTIAFSLLFLGLTFGIAKAQVTHGLQDQKYTQEQLRDYGATMYGRGKMLKEMGEKMMVEGERMIREADAISFGIPAAPKKK